MINFSLAPSYFCCSAAPTTLSRKLCSTSLALSLAMRGERRKVVGKVTTPGWPQPGLLTGRAPILARPSDNAWLTNHGPAGSSVPTTGVLTPLRCDGGSTGGNPPSHYLSLPPSLPLTTSHYLPAITEHKLSCREEKQ